MIVGQLTEVKERGRIRTHVRWTERWKDEEHERENYKG